MHFLLFGFRFVARVCQYGYNFQLKLGAMKAYFSSEEYDVFKDAFKIYN